MLWEMDVFWLCVLLCANNLNVLAVEKTDPRVYLRQMEHLFTPETYMILMDKDDDEYIAYNTTGYFHATTRRTMTNSNANLRRTYYSWTSDSQYTMCYLIQTIYRGASSDYQRYVPLRQLYTAHKDYAYGYMIFDIVNRYQNILEIFQSVKKWFGDQPGTYHYPVGLMIHLYTTILKQGKSITHLVNMLREINPKYTEQTIFDDYTEKPEKGNKTRGKGKHKKEAMEQQELEDEEEEETDTAAELLRVQESMAREQKKRARARKKQMLAQMHLIYKPTTPSRLQKKGPFELHYGWSIEDWV